MIDDPGSLAGNRISPIPHLGPEPRVGKLHEVGNISDDKKSQKLLLMNSVSVVPSNRMSFAIFIKDTATVFRAPLVSTIASCAAKASN